MFVHSELPGELRLVHGSTLTLETLEHADFVDFLQAISNFVLPDKGHVDIFVPLAATGGYPSYF